MSSARYAPLPNPHANPDAQNEMEAAFLLESDDEEEDRNQQGNDVPSSREDRANNGYRSLATSDPLSDELASPSSPTAPGPRPTQGAHARTRSSTYDFENVDYDADWTLRPPPGSPPADGDALRSFRESQGNSNGLIPDFGEAARQAARRARGAGVGGWLRRVVPSAVAERIGLGAETDARRAVGGGSMNDGVFANVTAKPSRGVRVQEGDNVFIVPEEVSKDAPPSYASAQADAVPPYWETTIHAPSASTAPGDMVVDALPTGSLFSFLWNMLVSISFQFVGFLLTYLLHTTHAAKLGSRAGLGVTLIQYGFAMRSRAEEWAREGSGNSGEAIEGWGWPSASPALPTFGTAAEADAYWGKMNTTALPSSTPSIPIAMSDSTPPNFWGDATTEWLSFFLMTVGWFILLTSLLSFWRVKRWERGILASSPSPSLPLPASSSSNPSGTPSIFSRMTLLRSGLGFPTSGEYPGSSSRSGEPAVASHDVNIFDDSLFAVAEGEDGELEDVTGRDPRGNYVIPIDESNPEQTHRLARAYVEDARLQRDLRAAGLL